MKINNLKFKVWSNNSKKIDVNICGEDWMLEKETQDGFTNIIYIDILGKESKSKKLVELGVLTGRYFRIGKAMNKNASLFDILII